MVKQEEDSIKIKTLEEENRILKQQIEDREKLQGKLGDGLLNEMKKIRAKGKSSANQITVVERHDHTNISLWTRDGKRIGPMHPENAIQTLHRFADIGISLSVDRPTADEIAKYKATPEYKERMKRESERRAIKDKSRRPGQMEKLAAEIAKISGTSIEALNHILKAHEVGKK